MIRFLERSILAVLFSILISGCVSDKEDPVWSLQPGDPLPEFYVETNGGSMISTDSFRGAKSVIVFFDTECPDCQAALPQIQEAYDNATASGENVRYLCISREESAEKIQKYWEENHLTLPYSAQTNRSVYNLFASSIIPRVYISNENLIIQKVYE